MNIKDILSGHPIYNRYIAYWNFLLSSYEGGVNYTGAYIYNDQSPTSMMDNIFRIFADGKQIESRVRGNLFIHPKERTKDYIERMNMSYYYNFCAPIIDIYINHLFKQAVVETYESIENYVDEVREDVDMKGSSISEFRKELSEMMQIYGHCFVIVDSPNINEEQILTKRDQIENRAFPYFSIHAPQSIINWSLDKFGNPYWVMVEEMRESNKDPEEYNKDEKKKVYSKLWTRTSWFLYEDEELIEQKDHNLGVVPIVCFYDKKSKIIPAFLGISSLSDIAFIARDIYNSCSELKQILRDQTFAFLAVQGSSDEYRELSVGTSKGLLYPEGRNLPQYISPPSSNAETYFKHIDRQVSKIYQLAKLEGGSGNYQGPDAVQQSGVSKAWDFNETNSSLSSKSASLEDGEMKMWKLFALWLGIDFDGHIQYPKEFSVSKIADDMAEAEQAAKLALGDTFQLEVLKTIQKKKFPSATEEQLEEMEDEAEQALNTKAQEANMMKPMGGLRTRLPNLFTNANSAEKGGLQ